MEINELTRKSFIEYHTSILEREINELYEEVVYWISQEGK